VNSEDEVAIQNFLSERKENIKFSEGQYALLCANNTSIGDARVVLQCEGQNPFLLVIQVRYTAANKYIGLPEITNYCLQVQEVIKPAYPGFQVIPVMITNRPLAEGADLEAWKKFPNLILVTEKDVNILLPRLSHRIWSEEVFIYHTPSINPDKNLIFPWNDLYKFTVKEGNKDSRSILEERAHDNGLALFEIKGDGNCQFAAVSHQLFGTPTFHLDLRASAVNWLIDNNLQQFVGDQSWDEYIYGMSMLEWGDNITLQAMAEVNCVEIIVISSYSGDEYISIITPTVFKKQIQLAYHMDFHYDSLIPLADKSKPRKRKYAKIEDKSTATEEEIKKLTKRNASSKIEDELSEEEIKEKESQTSENQESKKHAHQLNHCGCHKTNCTSDRCKIVHAGIVKTRKISN